MASKDKDRPGVATAALMVPTRFRARRDQAALHGHMAGSGGDLAPKSSDPSVLRPAISVAVTGMKQAVQVMEKSTPEVRHYLMQECNVIYECKVCLNLFRSLANWIAHKRSFCKAKFSEVRHVQRRDAEDYPSVGISDPQLEENYMQTAYVEPEEVDTAVPEDDWDLRNYSPSLELLKEAGFINDVEWVPQVTTLKPKKSINDVVNRLKYKQLLGDEADYYKARDGHSVLLEKIKQTDQAVFQNLNLGQNGQTIGQRYVELQRMKQRSSVFIGPDGKIVDPGPPPEQWSLFNSEEHEPDQHYKCPICKKLFIRLRGVTRHLIRGHNKSPESAEKLTMMSRRMRNSAYGTPPSDLFNVSNYRHYQMTPAFLCAKCFRCFYSGTTALTTHDRNCPKSSNGTTRYQRILIPRVLKQQENLNRLQPTLRLDPLSSSLLEQAQSNLKQTRNDMVFSDFSDSDSCSLSSDDDDDAFPAGLPRSVNGRLSSPRKFTTPTKISFSKKQDSNSVPNDALQQKVIVKAWKLEDQKELINAYMPAENNTTPAAATEEQHSVIIKAGDNDNDTDDDPEIIFNGFSNGIEAEDHSNSSGSGGTKRPRQDSETSNEMCSPPGPRSSKRRRIIPAKYLGNGDAHDDVASSTELTKGTAAAMRLPGPKRKRT